MRNDGRTKGVVIVMTIVMAMSMVCREAVGSVSPFEAVRRTEMTPEVRVDGTRPRVERAHASETPASWQWLVKRYEYPPHQQSARLSRVPAEQDLDELEWVLEDQYSYLALTGVDYRAGLDAIRANLGEDISKANFAIQVSKLLNRFGDGHTRVRGMARMLPAGYLPFSLADADGRPVAVSDNEWLDEAHPFVKSIDGVAIDRWIEVAREIVCAGSPQCVRRYALRQVQFLDLLRQEMSLPRPRTVTVELVSEDGSSAISRRLPIGDLPPVEPKGRASNFGRLGAIGYLRLAEMDSVAAAVAEEGMAALRDTDGLIIDVRGNGGGSRDALRVLFPYFMSPDAAPFVASAARYRLSDKFDEDHLEARYMQRRDDSRLDDADRRAIDAFAAEFEPEWSPQHGAFSDWHYLLLAPSTNPSAYHYTKPVMVLLDAGCFSATDIFLGAFAELDNVTLLGTPSSGGSGRSQSVDLGYSGIRLRFSSMASYRPDGRLYDGRGIEVDVEVRRAAADLGGRTDTQLDEALKRLCEH